MPVLGALEEEVDLKFDLGGGDTGSVLARVGRLDKDELLALLRPNSGHRWHAEYQPIWGPTYRFLEKMSATSQITGWHVVWPQLQMPARKDTLILPGAPVSIPDRMRRLDRHDFSGSDRKHRDVAERLVGTASTLLVDPIRDVLRDGSTSTGVLMAYLARDIPAMSAEGKPTDSLSGNDWQDLVLLLSIVMPPDAANDHSNRIRWVVQRKELEGVAAVPVK